MDSWIPGALLVAAFPMHAMWFVGGVKGHLRRCRLRAGAEQEPGAIMTKKPKTWPVASDEAGPVAGCAAGDCVEVEMAEKDNDSLTDSPESWAASLASSSPRETPLLTPHHVSTAMENEEQVNVGYFEGIGGVEWKTEGGLGLVMHDEGSESG